MRTWAGAPFADIPTSRLSLARGPGAASTADSVTAAATTSSAPPQAMAPRRTGGAAAAPTLASADGRRGVWRSGASGSGGKTPDDFPSGTVTDVSTFIAGRLTALLTLSSTNSSASNFL